MKHSIRRSWAFTGMTLAVLSGCISTSQVLETGQDSYLVSSTADGMADAASAKQNAYKRGAEFCIQQNKRFKFVSSSSSKTRMGIDTTIDVYFLCLNANDPAYGRTNVQPVPDVVIEDARK